MKNPIPYNGEPTLHTYIGYLEKYLYGKTIYVHLFYFIYGNQSREHDYVVWSILCCSIISTRMCRQMTIIHKQRVWSRMFEDFEGYDYNKLNLCL